MTEQLHWLTVLAVAGCLAGCATTYNTPSGKPEATFRASQERVIAAADEWAKRKLWTLRDRQNGRVSYWSDGSQPLEGLDTMLFGNRFAYEIVLDLRPEPNGTAVVCSLIIYHKDSSGPADITHKPAGQQFCGDLDSIGLHIK